MSGFAVATPPGAPITTPTGSLALSPGASAEAEGCKVCVPLLLRRQVRRGGRGKPGNVARREDEARRQGLARAAA